MLRAECIDPAFGEYLNRFLLAQATPLLFLLFLGLYSSVASLHAAAVKAAAAPLRRAFPRATQWAYHGALVARVRLSLIHI